MIAFLAEVIGIRDDIYLGEGNRYMREVAAALQEGYEQGVLSRRPAVINLQCDIDHPTQTLADLLHLESRFGGLDGLRGRKFVISWAYSPSYGKPLSVPQGLIGLLTRFGMDVTLAYPEGYDLLPEVVELAGKQAAAAGGALPRQPRHGRGFRRRRDRLSQVLGADAGRAAAHRAAAEGRQGGIAGSRKRMPGRKRPPRVVGMRRGHDEAHGAAARRSTCTACRRTSAAFPARRGR